MGRRASEGMIVRGSIRPLGFEWLSPREMMAGDVTAAVVNGVLIVNGDDNANEIRILQDGANLKVMGLGSGENKTTVNGGNSFVAENVRRGVVVNLKDGDDLVLVSNVDGLRQSLENADDLEANVDVPAVAPVEIRGPLVIRGGQGNDRVGVNANVGRVLIATGAGDDRVLIAGGVAAALDIVTDGGGENNGGADVVRIANQEVRNVTSILTGKGDDKVRVEGTTKFGYATEIATGAGADVVRIGDADSNISTGRLLAIQTGEGDDRVSLKKVDVKGTLSIRTGDGADSVTLDEVRVRDSIFAMLGAGDDTLRISKTTAARAFLFGGLGTDTLTTSDNSIKRFEAFGFENQNSPA